MKRFLAGMGLWVDNEAYEVSLCRLLVSTGFDNL
jgi:hypothetical protein